MATDSQGKGDDSLFILLGALLLGVLAYYLLGDKIAGGYAYVRGAETWAFAQLPDSFFSWATGGESVANANKALDYMSSNPERYKTASFFRALTVTGRALSFLLLPIMGLLIFWLFADKNNRFTQKHTMKTLLKQESELWPELKPIVGVELVEGDISKGPWAASQTSLEFASANSLIKGVKTERIGNIKFERPLVNTEVAIKVFSEQLGGLWTGIRNEPLYVQAIFAALGLRILGGKDKALKQEYGILALRKLSATFNNAPYKSNVPNGKSQEENRKEALSTMDFTWVEDALQQIENSPYCMSLLNKASAQHAYTYTLMATWLQITRRLKGVQSVSMMIWLKPVDRRLFYVLNDVGRQDAFHPESVGALSHWLVEKRVGAAILTPQVSKAITHSGTTVNHKAEQVDGQLIGGLEYALSESRNDDYLETIFN